MQKQQADLRLPSAQLNVTAAPAANLRRAKVKKPQQSEISRLSEGFGELLPGLEAHALKAREDELTAKSAEVEALPFDELSDLLQSDDLKGELGIQFEATFLAVEARIGDRLGEGLVLPDDVIANLGSPHLGVEAKGALVDGVIAQYLEDKPTGESPYIQAGLRRSMAAVKTSALRDGERRAAAQALQTTLTEVEDEARDKVMAFILNEGDAEFDLSNMFLKDVSRGVPGTDKAHTDGLIAGLAAAAKQDHVAAFDTAERLRELKVLDDADQDRVTQLVLTAWQREENLANFGKSSAKADAIADLDAFVLDVLENKRTDAASIAELAQAFRDDPDMAAEMSAMRAKYPMLNDAEWDAQRLQRLDTITRENSRVQAALDRNNRSLEEDVKLALSMSNGVQAKFDEIFDDDWNTDQTNLAHSIFDRSRRQYRERVSEMAVGAMQSESNLSSRDQAQLESLASKGDTDGIRDLLSEAAAAHATPRELSERMEPQAVRDERRGRLARSLFEQYTRTAEEIGGEAADFSMERAIAEVARIDEERMHAPVDGWEFASFEEHILIQQNRSRQSIDLIRDTQVDDWIKMHATGDRNTQTDEDGALTYRIDPMAKETAVAILGEHRTDFPDFAGNMASYLSPAFFSNDAEFEDLIEDTNTEEFRSMLRTDPATREIMAELMMRVAPVSVDSILADAVGFKLTDGGLPLSQTLPYLEGTTTIDLGSTYIPGLVDLLEPHLAGQEMTEKGQHLRQKLIEQTGLDEVNFDLALPGIIQAQKGGEVRMDKSALLDMLRSERDRGVPFPTVPEFTLTEDGEETE